MDTKEVVRVRTSEIFRMIAKVIKWVIVSIIIGVVLYGLYIVFEIYFFGSLIFSVIVMGVIFFYMVQVPGEMYIECRTGDPNDEKNKSDVLGIFRIPNNIIQEYESLGANTTKFKTRGGNTINIVEKINRRNKTIERAWFDELSSWEFYVKKSTFGKLKDLHVELMDEVVKTKETREIYHQHELIKMLTHMEKSTDLEAIEKEYYTKLEND
jgi:hypothetical protein